MLLRRRAHHQQQRSPQADDNQQQQQYQQHFDDHGHGGADSFGLVRGQAMSMVSLGRSRQWCWGHWQLVINPLAAVAGVLLLALLIHLGLWQLRRAEAKEALLANQLRSAAAGPRPLADFGERQQAVGAEIQISGRLMAERALLLDNHSWQGQAGYQLVVPLMPDDGSAPLLVNLGWLAAGDRQQPPVVPDVAGHWHLLGRLRDLHDQPLLLKQTPPEPLGRLLRVQRLELAALTHWLPAATSPQLLLLDPEVPPLLPRSWPVTVMSPAKHRGYAVQWLTMAGALLLLLMAVALRRDPAGPIVTNHEVKP